jgi:hypothetical protein
VAERASSSALAPLPLPLVLHIFSLLSVDARACAACVSRGWYTTLLERSLWARLNLSPSSGVRVRVTDAVLAGAAAKACGQLAELDVSDCPRVSFEALLAAVQANGGALRELRICSRDYFARQNLDAVRIEQLLLAAPQLATLFADARSHEISVPDARRMLRNEPPFQPLRLRALGVGFPAHADEASMLTLAADMAAHASLECVGLERAPLHTLAALDALVDAALARQMRSVSLWGCSVMPAVAPALVRLFSSGALAELSILEQAQLLDGPSAALLGDALRANSTITKLCFSDAGFWRDPDAAATLLRALTGHASLRKLMLFNNNLAALHNTVAGAALGALIAADAPALTELDLSFNRLHDAALRPLFEALPANAHLRTLNVSLNNMSEAFARRQLLPAVRANTSLQKLRAEQDKDDASVREAEALVAARAAAA